jgi:uncharacterized protein
VPGNDPVLELGIVSDTHGLLRPELFRVLEGVHHILHAGDVGSPDLLTALEAVAPVTAVTGNTDGFDLRHRLPEVQELELGDLKTIVIHGHQFGRSPTPAVLRKAYPDAGLVVFGHTHRPVMVNLEGTWFVNPGSCGPRRFDLPVEVVRATLQGGLFQGRAISLAPPDA